MKVGHHHYVSLDRYWSWFRESCQKMRRRAMLEELSVASLLGLRDEAPIAVLSESNMATKFMMFGIV